MIKSVIIIIIFFDASGKIHPHTIAEMGFNTVVKCHVQYFMFVQPVCFSMKNFLVYKKWSFGWGYLKLPLLPEVCMSNFNPMEMAEFLH